VNMMKLLHEQFKNFRILFRNLSSLLLLILGPLALILLIGFAYSGEGIHDIEIGIVADDYESLAPAIQNFSGFGRVTRYETLPPCIQEMALQKTHVCMVFSSEEKTEDFPSGTIVFYYDNSRKALSSKVVDVLSKFFGREAEKISIDSARSIFGNIQNMVIFLDQKNSDLYILVNESNEIRNNLLLRKEKLVEVREEFKPSYEKIKVLQTQLDNTSTSIDGSYEEFNSSLSELESELRLLRTALALTAPGEIYIYPMNGSYGAGRDFTNGSMNLSSFNYTMEPGRVIVDELNLTIPLNESEDLSVVAALYSIDRMLERSDDLGNSTAGQYEKLRMQKEEIDATITILDTIYYLLETDIASTDDYILKIDAATNRTIEVQQELNSSLKDLNRITPGMAERLVKPIIQNYEPALGRVENIQIAFPGMLTIIIIFISILFANIITLSEINSKAFYRNRIAPVNLMLFLAGLFITNMLVVFFQVSVLLLVAEFSFKVAVFENIVLVFAMITLLVGIFTSIGMLIAIWVRNEQSSVLTSTFIALGTFLFSDSVTPLEAMPKLASAIASFNPYVIASTAFRKLLIYQIPYVQEEAIILGIILAVTVIALLVSKKNIEK
jgi:ABC-type multidrug transport system permease subunit